MQKWLLNPLGPFSTLLFMHTLVLEESLSDIWTRKVCDNPPSADSVGTPGSHGWMVRGGFEIRGKFSESVFL